MAIERPIIRESHTVRMEDLEATARAILDCCAGQPVPLVEQALVWAYLHAARGVRTFPQVTMAHRALLVHHRALEYLVDQIVEVGQMSDDAVRLAVAQAPTTSVM